MTKHRLPTPRKALVVCLLSALGALVVSTLVTVAVLAHAPAAAIPFVIAICVGAPLVAASELSVSIVVLRGARRARARAAALKELRTHLDRLPETQHPLGL